MTDSWAVTVLPVWLQQSTYLGSQVHHRYNLDCRHICSWLVVQPHTLQMALENTRRSHHTSLFHQHSSPDLEYSAWEIRNTGWRRKKRGHPISLQIFWKFHDWIAWKLVNFCNIICWTQSLTFCLKISSRHLAKTPLLCDAQIYLYNVNKRQ